jgi:hypothetical protein
MKRLKLVPAVLLSAALLSGCSGFGTASSAAPAYSQTQQASSAAPAAAASSAAARQSAAPASSAPAASAAPASSAAASGQQTTVTQNGPVKIIETDSAAFNAKFAANPIDKAYSSDMAGAASTLAMVTVSGNYTGLWNAEVSHACEQLKTALKDNGDKLSAFEADQQKWEDGKTAALAKITAEANATGGSLARLNAASGAMEYVRSRAAALYRQLYDLDPNFTYAYHS